MTPNPSLKRTAVPAKHKPGYTRGPLKPRFGGAFVCATRMSALARCGSDCCRRVMRVEFEPEASAFVTELDASVHSNLMLRSLTSFLVCSTSRRI